MATVQKVKMIADKICSKAKTIYLRVEYGAISDNGADTNPVREREETCSSIETKQLYSVLENNADTGKNIQTNGVPENGAICGSVKPQFQKDIRIDLYCSDIKDNFRKKCADCSIGKSDGRNETDGCTVEESECSENNNCCDDIFLDYLPLISEGKCSDCCETVIPGYMQTCAESCTNVKPRYMNACADCCIRDKPRYKYYRWSIWSIENHVCMFSNPQEFVEELQSKEEEISKVIKMADNFKDESQVSLDFAPVLKM